MIPSKKEGRLAKLEFTSTHQPGREGQTRPDSFSNRGSYLLSVLTSLPLPLPLSKETRLLSRPAQHAGRRRRRLLSYAGCPVSRFAVICGPSFRRLKGKERELGRFTGQSRTFVGLFLEHQVGLRRTLKFSTSVGFFLSPGGSQFFEISKIFTSVGGSQFFKS